MNDITQPALISDVVWASIVSNGFWLIVFLISVTLFRRQLRSLLSSVGSFSIAGSRFELKDKKTTLESYAILANILIQMLSTSGDRDQLSHILSSESARQLGRFALKYIEEVKGDRDVELLKNIALIEGWKGNRPIALLILDTLLGESPEDRVLRDARGSLLLKSGVATELQEAEQIYNRIIEEYPEWGFHYLRRAKVKLRLNEYLHSIEDLERAVDLEQWKSDPNMLEAREFQPLATGETSKRFKELKEQVEQLKRSN